MHVDRGDVTLVIDKRSAAATGQDYPIQILSSGTFSATLAFNHPERRLWPS